MLGFRFHLYSDEGNEPSPIHVDSGDGECKFWLNPVALARMIPTDKLQALGAFGLLKLGKDFYMQSDTLRATMTECIAMSSIWFDTHRFVRKPQEAGFDERQAEGLTEAMRLAIDESELVTKKDLQIELLPIKADLNLLKWMMGGLIAIAVANFSKLGHVLE